MAKDQGTSLDTELEELPPELRWRTWVGRIEAVLFASATLVPREALQKVVGQGASVDLLIEDLRPAAPNAARLIPMSSRKGSCWYSISRACATCRIWKGWMRRCRGG